MKNTDKVVQIKRSWFGNWVSGSNIIKNYRGVELLDFHLLDDAQIMFKVIVIDDDLKMRIKCEVFSIADFEKVFNISISDLINL